jgi:rare lipoprotein A
LQDAQQQAATARAKLAQMREGLAADQDKYDSASNDLAQTRKEVSANSKKLSAVKASLKKGQSHLGNQVEFLYRTGGTGFVDVLLGASTFEEFATRLSLLKGIASADAGLVESLKSQRQEVEQLTNELTQREAKQEALLGKVKAQRAGVQGSIDQQQNYINSLSAQVAAIVAAQETAAARSTPSQPSTPVGSGPKADSAPSASGGKVKLGVATVDGKGGYVVMASEPKSYRATGVSFDGVSSEYSNADNGTGTSSGRTFNDQELTCAHPSLRFGTRLAVSRGSRKVIVIVTDRGPYTHGRVLDLTTRAASILGLDGVGKVHCEVVQSN